MRWTARRYGAMTMAMCVVGVSLPAAAGAQSEAGGAFASAPAAIAGVACQRACPGVEAADAGSVLRVRGRSMASVRTVLFLGGPGGDDDVAAAARRVRAASVDVVVPAAARTGRVALRNADGATSAPSRDEIAIGEPQPDPSVEPVTARVVDDAPESAVVDARVQARSVYYAGEVSPTLRLLVKTPSPVPVTVALVRVADGAVVGRWSPASVEPGTVRSITWDGKVAGRVPTKAGRYQFQVWTGEGAGPATPAATATASQADRPEAADTFEFRPYAFPIEGKHAYGEGGGRFGAARGGGGHQGQDVFAECGTPVVAARGGTVSFKEMHARAGNYVVIDGDGTGQDMAYMHLREAALVDVGDAVGTGQLIGHVGDTGAADGCHLHFELWTAPGWQEGGTAIDPLAVLKSWDKGGAATRRGR